MRIGCLEEIHAIGDNATRFKALAILRALYPNDTVIFYGRKNVAQMFFHSNVFDEFVNIEGSLTFCLCLANIGVKKP